MSYYDPDLGRNVLIQDAEQVQQTTKKARETRERKEQTDYDTTQKEYEKDVKSAEAQYQKDLAEYNRQQAEIERLAKQQNKFDAEIARLEAQKQKELADAHYSVWGPGGSRNRSELATKQNTIQKNYDSKINKAVEQKRRDTGYQEFSIAYPGEVLPSNVAKAFRESKSFSLTDLYQTKIEGKAAKAEYQRQASIQTAQNIARRESIEYHSNIPNIGFITGYGLEKGSERAGAIRSTPDAHPSLLGGGKKAVETRQRLTNVDTGQSIMGAQSYVPEITITRTETYRETPDGPVLVRNVERTIPERKASKGVPSNANPLAFVAALDRQNVDAAGRSPEQKTEAPRTIFSFQNVSEVKDPSAVTLLEFQSQLKTRTAPSATVYKGILEEKGLPVTPLASRIIDTYSSKGLFRDYKEPTPAKGRKAIISKDGKQVFDIETGLGDVTIGRKLGFVYDYNLQRPTEEKPVLFEGSLQYVLAPKIQGPQQPKLEEAKAFPGTLEYAVASEPKQTSFNKSLENQYNKLGELQEITAKKAQSGDPRDILVQIAYAPSEAMRSIIGAGGSIVNLFEQNIDPITEKQLNLKRTARPAPIIFQSDVSGTTVLPYDFEAQKWSVPILDKSYELRQRQAIEKRGLPAYIFGIGVDYYGLKGAPSLIKTGARVAPKLLSKLAVPVGKKQLLAVKGGITTPSKVWDVSEKVGFRIGKPVKIKVQQIGKITTQEPVPNPFGKERVVPYNLQKAQQRIVGGIQTTKTKAVQVGGKVKTAIQKDSRIPSFVVQGKNQELPNITRPAKPDFSKTLESMRIGFEAKKSAFAKRLSEMDKIYRGGIEQPTSPYSRRLESLGIGLRVKRQEFTRGISNIGKNIPNLKTPKGIIKFKKQVKIIAKRTSKGIEKRRELLAKNLSKLKPTIKAPYLPQKTSLEIAKFKQKEKLDATLARMRKVAVAEEKPKVVVPRLSKNFLSRLKSGRTSEPWDFKSIVKPFQKPSLRKEFASGIRGAPIGKIKGTTSRKEFAEFLKSDIDLPKTKLGKFPFRSKKDVLFSGSFDIKRQSFLTDIQKIRRKGSDFIERQNKFFNARKGSYASSDIRGELIRADIKSIMKKPRGVARIKAETQSLVRRGKLRVSADIKSGKIKNVFVDLNLPKIKSFVGLKETRFRTDIKNIMFKSKRFTELQKSERFSAPFTKAGLGIKKKSVKELIGEGLSKETNKQKQIQNILDLAKKGKLKISDAFVKKNPKLLRTQLTFSGTDYKSAKNILEGGPIETRDIYHTKDYKYAFGFSREGYKKERKTGEVLGIETVLSGGKKGEIVKITGEKKTWVNPKYKSRIEGASIEKNVIENTAVKWDRNPIFMKAYEFTYRPASIKIKTGFKVNLPSQIKPIFPVPRKPTELENILEGFKKEKPKGQPYKKVRIDKYVPKYPKEWEKWRGVGIVTAAGTITALGLGQEKAEALPLVQIGKIAGRTVESGGQILIYPEVKSGGKSFGSLGKTQKTPSLLVPPTLKETQREDDEEITLFARPKTRQVLTVLPKVSFEFSTPQRVQESIRPKTIQPAKITVAQKPRQTTRQKQKARTIQVPKYEIAQIQRVSPRQAQKQTPKLASPLAPKAPTRLRAPQRQPLREKPVEISLLRTRPPRKPPRVVFALPPDREPEKKKETKKEKSVLGFFLGNVPETQISGVFKRKEITLGKEKIERTRRGDVRVLAGKPRKVSRKKQQYDLLGFKKGKTKFF